MYIWESRKNVSLSETQKENQNLNPTFLSQIWKEESDLKLLFPSLILQASEQGDIYWSFIRRALSSLPAWLVAVTALQGGRGLAALTAGDQEVSVSTSEVRPAE